MRPCVDSVIRVALALFASCALAGCFTSYEPLISPEDADFPFESLTYTGDGSSEEITLKRSGDSYVPVSDREYGERLLLKAMGDKRYIAQIDAPDSDRRRFLYGIIVVAPDNKSFAITANMAEKSDMITVQKGIPGLSTCPGENDSICIESLEGYLAYGRRSDGSPSEKHRIIRMQ